MNRFTQLVVGVLVLAAFAVHAIPGFARSWTDPASGQKFDGDFIRVSRGKAVIKMGGKFVQIPLGRLTKEDRDFVYKQEAHAQGDHGQGDRQKPSDSNSGNSLKSADKDKSIIAVVETGGVKSAIKLGPERKWTDNQGRSVQARFVGMDNGKVILFYQDKLKPYPLDSFSKDDQDYVRKEMAARGEASKLPSQLAQAPPKSSKPKSPKTPKHDPPANTAPPPAQPPEVASNPRPAEPAQPDARRQIEHSATAQPSTSKTSASQPAQSLLAKGTSASKPASVAVESPVPAPPEKSKVCSACGHQLPNTVKYGDSCPNCGAYLQYEDTDQGRQQASSTLRTLGAPVGLASLGCVIAIAVFRLRSYAR